MKDNRRSGGGKVVTENWDTLVFLWEGSPSVTSLPFGQKSAEGYDDDTVVGEIEDGVSGENEGGVDGGNEEGDDVGIEGCENEDEGVKH